MDEFTQNIAEELQKSLGQHDPVATYVIPGLKIVGIIIVSFVVLRYSGSWIERLFNLRRVEQKKSQTLAKLLKSIIYYAVYFVAGVTILSNLGVDLMPLIAGAGVVGLAIGFGAQNLVRDVISGFFLIFENQLHVGDYVQINGKISGTVEEIGLRVTKIREWNQRLHYLTNGEISQIANYNRDQMSPIVSVTVPYEEEMDKVLRTLEHVCRRFAEQHEPHFFVDPAVYGITKFDHTGVEYTVTATCTPEQYWYLERELRRAIIQTFNEENIRFAYPRRVLYEAQEESSYPYAFQRPKGESADR